MWVVGGAGHNFIVSDKGRGKSYIAFVDRGRYVLLLHVELILQLPSW